MKIGRLTLSDRASAGVYEDKSGPEIDRILSEVWAEKIDLHRALIPDHQHLIEKELIRLADEERCELIVTTGGTGPAKTDVTPEATRTILEKELPGFGEILRVKSFDRVPTAILSRATAGTRKKSLIINLPGNPKAIGECLPLLLPAITEAIDHLTGHRPQLKRDPQSDLTS